MGRLVHALVSTSEIILIIILIGVVINMLSDKITQFLYKHFGKFITILVMNYITFIGVIHHELAHAIFAFLTGAKVIKVQLFSVNKNTLGQVLYVTRGNAITKSIQDTLASVAPVIAGMLSEYYLYRLLTTYDVSGALKLVIYYIMVSILCHMRMSKQDLRMFLRGLPIFCLVMFVIIYITQVNILSMI